MSDHERWWREHHPLDWWRKQRNGNPLPERDRLLVWDLSRQTWDAAVEAERIRWSKAFSRIAEVSHNDILQAALWRVAEMLERNQEHQHIQTNSAAIRRSHE